jgi:uncharacterized protein (DUF1778 family)
MVARNKKATILVRCTAAEAKRIRKAAESERRTISGFIINAVKNRIDAREKMTAQKQRLPLRPAEMTKAVSKETEGV